MPRSELRKPVALSIFTMALVLALGHIAQAQTAKTMWIRVRQKRSEFWVFTHSGQSLSSRLGTSTGSTISGAAGTIISIDDNRALLHNGFISISGGKSGGSIKTRLCSVNVPAMATVLVDSDPISATIGVFDRDGKVAVAVRNPKGRLLADLKPGEEIIFLPSEMQPHAAPADAAAKQLWNRKAAEITSANAGEPIRVLAAEGTEFRGGGNNVVGMRHGEIFVDATNSVMIQGPIANVIAPKGSISDISIEEGDIRTKSFSAAVEVAIPRSKHSIYVDPGNELLVSPSELTDAKLNPPDGIGRRAQKKLNEPEVSASMAEFSITSFLNQAPHVHRILQPSSPDEKHILARLLKTAAAVQTVNARSGPYHSTSRPQPRPTKETTDRRA